VFYAEQQTGRLRVLIDGAPQDAAVADVPVNASGDRGLLGVAVDPNFATSGRVYVFYSRSDTGADTTDSRAILDQRIVYFTLAGNTAPDGEVFVASIPAGTSDTHVGGRLAFGADGKLYAALGDLGDPGAAQDGNSLAGKVLRLNSDGTVPSDNPTAGSAVYARGLRDPRGLSFDAASDSLYCVDRQSGERSELNRVTAGANLGWPIVTGAADTADEEAFAATTPVVAPLLTTGGAQARLFAGVTVNPSYRYGPTTFGHVFYADANNGRVIEVTLDAGRTSVTREATFASNFPEAIADVMFTPAGTLYVTTESEVFRLAPRP
jgi:glucose/arabinose dehydrogenase